MPALFGAYQPSGTYAFAPSNMEVIASAYARIQIKRTELEQNHIVDGISELNLFLASFNNVGPNLAQVDLQQITLVQGTIQYTTPVETVMVLDAFLTFDAQGDQSYLFPISRTEYAAIPNKTRQGRPNQYWLNRQRQHTFNLYPVPDGNGPYTLNYYRFRQVQDSVAGGGSSPELPNRAFDALVAGLAYRLARIYKPELEMQRKVDAGEAWTLYAKQDTEFVNMYISPSLVGYWRIR